MYHFVRCQPDTKCPDLQGWYLILEPDTVETLEKLHRGVAHFYYAKYGMNPHIDVLGKDWFKHPIRLAALWLQTIEKFLAAGTTLAVNSSGGMLPLDDVKVLATTESERMAWPDLHEDEIVTISLWPEGKHFYLSSNKNRVFVPPQYVRYEDALHAAKIHTENIETKGC